MTFVRSIALAAAFAAPLVAVAEVPVVENPATPAEGRVVVDADMLWRVGGYDETYLFGVVDASAVDEDGITYLLDSQLSEITAIDPEGNTVATFGREGEGPGEMSQGQGIMILPDGRIGVLNMRPPKLITYSKQGEPMGDVSLAGNEGLNFTNEARAAGDHVLVQTKNTSFAEKTQTSTDALRAIDLASGGTLRDVLVKTEERDRLGGGNRMVITFGDGFVDEWEVFEDGRVAIVEDDEIYAIDILGPDGETLRTVRRAGERVRRPEAEIDRDVAQRKNLAERMNQTFDPDDVDPLYPAIVSIHARPNGELWVLTGEGLHPLDMGIVGVFDVFDTDGRFVRQVEVRAPYDRSQDRFTIQGDALVVYEDLVAARGAGFFVSEDGIAEETPDGSHAEPLAVTRYRF